MPANPENNLYRSFLLRFKRADATQAWLITIEDLVTHEQVHFLSADDFISFFEKHGLVVPAGLSKSPPSEE